MQNVTFGDRVRYAFDNYMARGTIALILGLGVVSALIIFLAGLLISVAGIHPPEAESYNLGEAMWLSMMRTLDAGKRIGAIELFGFGKRRTIPIETGDGFVSAGTVRLEGLPSKVRRLRVALASPSLRVETASCGTKPWTATLGDRVGNFVKTSVNADVRCPRGGK